MSAINCQNLTKSSWLDFWLSFVKQLNEWIKHEAICPEKLSKFPNIVLIGFWIWSSVTYESHKQQALKVQDTYLNTTSIM